MVWETQVTEFESKSDKVGDEVRCVDAAVNKDGAVDVGMRYVGERRGLSKLATYKRHLHPYTFMMTSSYLERDQLVIDTSNVNNPDAVIQHFV